MAAPPKQHAIRRSTRLPLEVPIVITSLDPKLGYSEACTTTLVNAHGCGLITQRGLPRNLPVRLEIMRSGRQTTARVADVVPLGGEPETWLLGLELDTPGNVWGIEYAPSDWKLEEAHAPAETSHPSVAPVESPKAVPAARRWRLTDISAGACYLEGAQSVPMETPVLISIRVAQEEALLDGVVRASHPHGIGVEFTSKNHRKIATELINRLMEQREVPRVFVGHKEGRSHGDSSGETFDAGTDDPLLELIREGGTLSLEDFLEDLRAQRSGQRREPRVDLALTVRLSGRDLSGKAIVEEVRTRNVSRRGAQLEGVDVKVRPGETVSLTYAGHAEEFRIAWVGASLTPLAGQIGVVAIDKVTSMWDAALAEHSSQGDKGGR